MHQRKKILWLVSWYPNKYNPYDGDFVQRHARAAALHHDVHVLFIKQAEEQSRIEESREEKDGLTEQIIYLPKQRTLSGKLTNYRHWKKHYQAQVRLIVEHSQPFLIHVHIPWKAGLIAQRAKKEFNIPYLITEHWGIYNHVVDDNIYTKPFVFRWLLKIIFQKASAFISVSRYLGEGVNRALLKKAFTVIPNVVDTRLFYPAKEKHDRFTFIHVSNMVALKNVEGILEAFGDFLSQAKAAARLVFVGNRDDRYKIMMRQFNLPPDSVFFKGEIPYSGVAREMRQCHAFVLNSNIENSPCVIGEALCCGLPVIATAVGGIPELVTEENGLLVPPANRQALAKAMISTAENYARFNANEIASAAAEKFSPQAVGAAMSRLYAATKVVEKQP